MEEQIEKPDVTPTKTDDRSRHGLRKVLLAVFVVLLIGSGIYIYIRYQRTHVTTDDAYIKGHIHWIYPRIPGTVIKVFVDENQYVRKGQLLVVLDPKRYEIRLAQAKAELAVAISKSKVAQASVKVGLSEIALNKAEYLGALHDFDRAKLAYPKKVISRQAYDHYLTAYKAAEARLLASQEKLKYLRDQAETARAQVELCRKKVDAASLDLQYTRIGAPIEGYIARKTVEVGNRVGSQVPLFAIVPLNDLWIEANYKESQLRYVKTGQRVRIAVDAYPGEKLSGRVESIQAGSGAVFSLFPPENATGNWVKITQRIPVRIRITSQSKKILRIGMSVETTILVK